MKRLWVILLVALLLVACDPPEWANWSVAIRWKETGILHDILFCQSFTTTLDALTCQRPESEGGETVIALTDKMVVLPSPIPKGSRE